MQDSNAGAHADPFKSDILCESQAHLLPLILLLRLDSKTATTVLIAAASVVTEVRCQPSNCTTSVPGRIVSVGYRRK